MFNTNLFYNTGSVSAPEEYLISAGQGYSFIKWSGAGSALVTRSISNGAGTAYGYALTKASDRIFLGGWFTISLLPGGSTTNDIVKVDLGLVKDTTFSTNPAGGSITDTGVRSLALDGSGSIYVGGSFTTWNSVAANRIVKLGATGAKDTSFDNSTGFNNTVFALAVDSNGKIYCGGDFTTYKGTTANKIVRLNTDGSIDSGFNPTVGGSYFFNTVRNIKIDSNGKILVAGGYARSMGGGSFTGGDITRFNTDGSVDNSWQFINVNFGFIPVSQLEIDSNGKIYFCGDFTSLSASGGSPTYNYKYLARLNSDGTIDTGFDTTNKFNGIVNGISISPSTGKIYCGGLFTTYDSQSYKYLIRLNTDASIDSTFNPGTTLPTGNYPIALLSY